MSITPREPADFTPSMGGYTPLTPFRYWCQKVLPLVYDDSLSYYEVLCKVVDYLNKTMEDVETLNGDVTDLHTAYVQLQNYVNSYFASLNVQNEINNKLDKMASDGTLDSLLLPYFNTYKNEINGIISEQNDHIEQQNTNISQQNQIIQRQNDNIDVLTSRMDGFSNLPNGSTSGDAELIDIRVGANGFTYPNAGDSVRGQVGDINNTLESWELPLTYTLKGWENGTGFTDFDSTMGCGLVLKNDTYDMTLYTDFSRFSLQLYYFTSPTNKYPHYEGNLTQPFTVPKGQYFTFFVRYKNAVSPISQADITYIPTVTFCKRNIGIWEKIDEIENDTSDELIDIRLGANGITYPSAGVAVRTQFADVNNALNSWGLPLNYALKGWVDGTGFVDVDYTMGCGEILKNDDYSLILSTDFRYYSLQLFYFKSPTDLYPHHEGNLTSPFTVPKGQYFTFFVRYKAGVSPFDQVDIDYIPTVTFCKRNIGIWNKIDDVEKLVNVPNTKYPFNYVMKDFNYDSQIQDGILVNDKIYLFTPSGMSVGEYYGHILTIDVNTLTLVDDMYHDLGHFSCVGYNKQKDTLFTGRILNNVPTIQMYSDFSEKLIPNSVLEVTDTNYKSITLNTELLEGRTSFEVYTGECYNILYGYCTKISEYNNVVVMYKILLGTGSTNLSIEKGGYGTYTLADDGKYNGTCKIIGKWYLPSVNRQPQLIRLHNGSIYMMTSNRDTVVHKYKFDGEEYTTETLYHINDLTPSGTIVDMECECVLFDTDKTYMCLWDKVSPTKIRLLSVNM